jgi:hypothetical protein
VLGNNGSLTPGNSAAFWITVKAPTTGAKLTLNSTFGGDEGNGGGNGCCDSVASTNTTLVDPLTGSTVKPTHALSFRGAVERSSPGWTRTRLRRRMTRGSRS